MELPKDKMLQLIHKRLDKVSTSLKELDAAYAKKSALEAELAGLRRVETDLISNDD